MWITPYKSFFCVNILPKLEIYTVVPLPFQHKLMSNFKEITCYLCRNFNKTKISTIKFEMQTFQDQALKN